MSTGRLHGPFRYASGTGGKRAPAALCRHRHGGCAGDTPLVAILHWHGFRRATPLVLPGVEIPPRPVPGTAVQIDAQWHDVEAVDAMLLDAAWQFGVWEVERVERRGCNVIGASAAEALACRQAFGHYESNAARDPHLLDGAIDRDDLMHLAARCGYLRWLVKGGLWPGTGRTRWHPRRGWRSRPALSHPAATAALVYAHRLPARRGPSHPAAGLKYFVTHWHFRSLLKLGGGTSISLSARQWPRLHRGNSHAAIPRSRVPFLVIL